nr:two-component sensor histidine kinase [Actinoplanes derwentensis]
MGRVWDGRAWDVAAILVSWFGGLLLAGDAAEIRGLDDDTTFLIFLSGCVLSLALWWRRSHPMPVALFLAAAATVDDAAGAAALIALYTVVARRRGRPVVAIVAVNLLGGAVYSVLYPDPSVPTVVSLVLSVAITATTVALGTAARSRRELIESLRERAARAEEESRLRADTLRALERERIAREMHDALAHRISMVSLHAGALHIRPDLTPDEVARAATLIRDSAAQALDDLREILGILRAGPTEDLRPQPDLSHVPELVAEAGRAGLSVTFTDRLGSPPVGASLGRTVYRLIQEGLTNAAKHAPSTPVTVLLDGDPSSGLHIHISNPLPTRPRRPTPPVPRSEPSAFRSASAESHSRWKPAGPRAASAESHSRSGPSGSRSVSAGSPSGSGLIGLAERVDLLDGRLRHGVYGDPRTGLTFDLEAWLPWPPTPSTP